VSKVPWWMRSNIRKISEERNLVQLVIRYLRLKRQKDRIDLPSVGQIQIKLYFLLGSAREKYVGVNISFVGFGFSVFRGFLFFSGENPLGKKRRGRRGEYLSFVPGGSLESSDNFFLEQFVLFFVDRLPDASITQELRKSEFREALCQRFMHGFVAKKSASPERKLGECRKEYNSRNKLTVCCCC